MTVIIAAPKLVSADINNGSLGTSYTAPTAVPADWGTGYATAQVKHISVCNGNASAAVVTVAVGGKNLLSGYTLPAKSTFDWEGTLPLGTTQTVQSQADNADCDILIGVVEFFDAS